LEVLENAVVGDEKFPDSIVIDVSIRYTHIVRRDNDVVVRKRGEKC